MLLLKAGKVWHWTVGFGPAKTDMRQAVTGWNKKHIQHVLSVLPNRQAGYKDGKQKENKREGKKKIQEIFL